MKYIKDEYLQWDFTEEFNWSTKWQIVFQKLRCIFAKRLNLKMLQWGARMTSASLTDGPFKPQWWQRKRSAMKPVNHWWRQKNIYWLKLLFTDTIKDFLFCYHALTLYNSGSPWISIVWIAATNDFCSFPVIGRHLSQDQSMRPGVRCPILCTVVNVVL